MVQWALYSLLFSFVWMNQSLAIDFEDAVYPELITSGRALAMGNAFISKVDDSSASFYNPAGLGTVRYPHLHLSNFHAELNKGLLSSGTGGRSSDAISNSSKMFSLDGIRDIIKDKRGAIAHSRYHALPNFTARYLSFGYMIAKRTRATVLDTTSATGFEYADRTDHGPYAALNISLFGGVIKGGGSMVFLNRKEVSGSSNPQTTLNIANNYKKGNVFLTTLGGKLTLPVTFLPTFSITMHNALNQEFQNGRGAGVPDQVRRNMVLGFSITPQIGTSTRLHLEANYKDFTKQYPDVASGRKILVGAELDFRRVFFFRVGYGDGFGSAGLGVKTRWLEFDLTTYAVDTTTAQWRGEEDRRFALTVSSGF